MITISAGEPTLAGATWRYRLLVLVSVLAFLAAGVVYAEARAPVYTATASMVLQDPHSDPVFATSTNQPPDRYTTEQIAVLKSPQLAAAASAAAQKLNPPLYLSADDFSSHTVVSGTPLNGNLVQINFTAVDQQSALTGADAIKTAYERTVHDAVSSQLTALLTQIDSELSSINGQLTTVAAALAGPTPSNQPALTQQQAGLVARRDTLNAKRDQVVVDASSGSDGVALYLAPQTATHSSKLVTALPVLAVAAVLGLVAGIVAAYVLASRRRIFRGREEPEALIGAPLIAEIPRFHSAHRLPAADGEPAAAATAFRTAAFLIQSRQAAAAPREVPRRRTRAGGSRMVVVSASRGDGRSTVAANLGLALADSGLSTLLVDADPTTGGLSHLLHDRFDLVAAGDAVRVSLGAAGMSLEDVTRPGDPGVRLALLRTARDRQRRLNDADRDNRLQELESAFDVVVIDAPSVSDAGPSWPLVRRADSALVLVTDRTPVPVLEEVMRLLKAIEIPAFGYVYNHGRRARRTARGPEKKAAPVSPSASAAERSVSA